MRSSPILSLAAAAFAIALCSGATAQRMHVEGLIGEPPDTSNWPHPAAPDGNPFPRSTATPAELAVRNTKIQLGKALFWDEQLSSDGTMSCGTCHISEFGGTDPRNGAFAPGGNQGSFGMVPQHVDPSTARVSYGHVNPPSSNIDRLITGVFTPTMIGAYVFDRQFWDRRAGPDFQDTSGVTIPNFDDWAGLEDQAVEPPVSPVEMGHEDIDWTDGTIQARLNAALPLALVDPATIPPSITAEFPLNETYRKIFDKVFFSDPQFGGTAGVTRERFAIAVAHYMRSLIPDGAPIDRGTMNASETLGFDVVRGSGCFVCHAVGNDAALDATGRLTDPFDNPFSDGLFHNIGIGPSVKTPTLRNVGLRTRFFSTGLGGPTLSDLVTFYENQPLGGVFQLNGLGGGPLSPAERQGVLDFLGNGLTDPRVVAARPPFDRPELASERPEFSPFEVNEFGNATPGASGALPEIIANMPPHVRRPALSTVPSVRNVFRVGVGDAAPLSSASLLVSNTPGTGPILWVGSPFTVTSATTTNANGIATAHLPFPLTTATIGVPFFCQWVVADGGIRSLSDAASFTPFQF